MIFLNTYTIIFRVIYFNTLLLNNILFTYSLLTIPKLNDTVMCISVDGVWIGNWIY
jgi:hypothetical protein